MRVRFNDMFHVNGDGSISPRVPIVVGGVPLHPGVEFGRRVRLGNVHFAGVAGRDLEVDQQQGVYYLLRPSVAPMAEQPPPPPPMVSPMSTEPAVETL